MMLVTHDWITFHGKDGKIDSIVQFQLNHILQFLICFSLQWEVNWFSHSCSNTLCSRSVPIVGLRAAVSVHTRSLSRTSGSWKSFGVCTDNITQISIQYIGMVNNMITVMEIINLGFIEVKQQPVGHCLDCRTGNQPFPGAAYSFIVYVQDKLHFLKTCGGDRSRAIYRHL